MDTIAITKATLSRLPDYLCLLKGLSLEDTPYISATAIAKTLSLGEVQVRKDLQYVCGKGKPKLGYCTEELIESIETILCSGNLTSAVLVGVGKLGRALLEYEEFEKYGVKIAAAFDCSEDALKTQTSVPVYDMKYFDDYCRKNSIKLGIITVGESSAEIVCRSMIDAGITAIWNFAPRKLNVPDNVLFLQENLALSLAHLNNRLCSQSKEK